MTYRNPIIVCIVTDSVNYAVIAEFMSIEPDSGLITVCNCAWKDNIIVYIS